LREAAVSGPVSITSDKNPPLDAGNPMEKEKDGVKEGMVGERVL